LCYDLRSSHLRCSGSLRARSCRPAACRPRNDFLHPQEADSQCGSADDAEVVPPDAEVATGFTPGRIARTDRTQGHNRGINPLATWKCGRRGERWKCGRRGGRPSRGDTRFRYIPPRYRGVRNWQI